VTNPDDADKTPDDVHTAAENRDEAADPTEDADVLGEDAAGPTGEAPSSETDAHPIPGEQAEPPTKAARPRSRSATAAIAVLVMLLGFALVVQVRSRGDDAGLEAARPEDLVRILSDLDAQQTRLRAEIGQLDTTERRLSSGAQSQDAALQEARRRADALGILAGTLPAKGPGLVIVFTPGGDPVAASTILDAVEELRGAGAEAMQLGDVRIVASTSFVDAGDGMISDGAMLRAPYTLTVIGDPQTMLTALNIPGGVVDSVRQHGGTVSVREADQVTVAALHIPTNLKYAHPVS
jgi:uncharacterized protein YlxW (UPF0749 family)